MIEDTEYSRENPSDFYKRCLEYYIQMHSTTKAFDGRSINKFVSIIKTLIRNHHCKTLLDYGSGKATLYSEDFGLLTDIIDHPLQEYWGLDKVFLYEPAIKGLRVLPPKPVDCVICTDVLEHIPAQDLHWVVDEICSKATEFVFLNICTFPALKVFPDGTNVHVSVFNQNDWLTFLSRKRKNFEDLVIYVYFDVLENDETISRAYKLDNYTPEHIDFKINRIEPLSIQGGI